MNRLRAIWSGLQSSFWFMPGLILTGSLLAAVLLIEVDTGLKLELVEWSPRLFGAGAEGSRAMLAAIATSMITVAGVVFSITIVTLSLTSTQYSPRVLRNFMRDRPTQVVLGVFVGIFAYCLTVLRTIRDLDNGDFVPSIAVLGGLVYALAGIVLLIYYIHHVAQSIQASSILARLSVDTGRAIDQLFPQDLGDAPESVQAAHRLPAEWVEVRSRHSGYLTHVDSDELLAQARRSGRVLRICARIGDFVPEGAALVAASGRPPVSAEDAKCLSDCLILQEMRTVDQDASFGLSQLVDVAVRALSPGMNDIATACMCVDRLGALVARLASRSMPGPLRFEGDELRVIAPAPDFHDLLHLSFEPVIRNSRGDLQVLERVMVALQVVRDAARNPDRRAALRQVTRELRMELQSVQPRPRSLPLRARLSAIERSLDLPAPAVAADGC